MLLWYYLFMKGNKMSKEEIALIYGFLNKLGDYLSNAGCNDMYLPNTEGMRDLVQKAEKECDYLNSPSVYDGKILTSDFLILHQVTKAFAEHFDVDKELANLVG